MKSPSPLAQILECEAAAAAEIALCREEQDKKIADARLRSEELLQQTDERIHQMRASKESEYAAEIKKIEDAYRSRTDTALSGYENRYNAIKESLIKNAAERMVRRE